MRSSQETRPTVVHRIFAAADRTPEKLAIVCPSEAVTYEHLRQRILSAAAQLETYGVGDGDRVVLEATPHPAFVYGYFASHLLGAIAVPIAGQIARSSLEEIVRLSDPRVIFQLDPPGAASVRPLAALNVPADASPRLRRSPIGLDKPADLLFTTGTTMRPKGVVLTQRNIAAAADNINHFIGTTADDREVVSLPLNHSFGLGRLRCNMSVGATVVIRDGFLVPENIFRAIEEWSATGLSCVPSGLALLFHLTGDRLGEYRNQLRYMEIGSASMPYEHKRRLMRLLPSTRLCMHYGLTEASRAAFLEFHSSPLKLGSIGQPAPNVVIRVLDGDGKEARVGELGQIAVTGEIVMSGYWKDAEKTEAAFVDGSLLTGDVGYRDEDGYLHFKGRRDDVINVGGIKVAPREVEEALISLPRVADCACVGVPDPNGLSGQVIKAYLVGHGGRPQDSSAESEAIANALRNRLEPHKLPVSYEWVDAIPRTPSGKVQRQLLRTGYACLTSGVRS